MAPVKRVLFLCTGNSCRSQVAEGLVNRDFAGQIQAFSAGTEPQGLDPKAVQVMAEAGIDISGHSSDHLSRYEQAPFDYVITLCGDAKENCPLYFGGGRHLHMGYPDPSISAPSGGSEYLDRYRRLRDDLCRDLGNFFRRELGANDRSSK